MHCKSPLNYACLRNGSGDVDNIGKECRWRLVVSFDFIYLPRANVLPIMFISLNIMLDENYTQCVPFIMVWVDTQTWFWIKYLTIFQVTMLEMNCEKVVKGKLDVKVYKRNWKRGFTGLEGIILLTIA